MACGAEQLLRGPAPWPAVPLGPAAGGAGQGVRFGDGPCNGVVFGRATRSGPWLSGNIRTCERLAGAPALSWLPTRSSSARHMKESMENQTPVPICRMLLSPVAVLHVVAAKFYRRPVISPRRRMFRNQGYGCPRSQSCGAVLEGRQVRRRPEGPDLDSLSLHLSLVAVPAKFCDL